MMVELIKIKVPKLSSVMLESVCGQLVDSLKWLNFDVRLNEASNIYQVSEPMMYNLYSDFTMKDRDDKMTAMAKTLMEDHSNSVKDVCQTLGVSRSTLYRCLRK